MPAPCFNVVNGGAHVGNFLAFHELFLALVGATSLADAMQLGSEVRRTLKGIIRKNYGLDSTAVGDEGGCASAAPDPEEGLKLLMEAREAAGHTGQIRIGFDPALPEFWKGDASVCSLDFKSSSAKLETKRTREQKVGIYMGFCEKYTMAFLEDPCVEEDLEGRAQLTVAAGARVEIVGEDLCCTNVGRVLRSERLAKYNQLLRIEEDSGLDYCGKYENGGSGCQRDGWARGVRMLGLAFFEDCGGEDVVENEGRTTALKDSAPCLNA